MLPASLRYTFLALILLCNALFFWNVEVRTDALLAFAFGASPAKQEQSGGTRLVQTHMQQSSAYTFANPARMDRAPR